MHLLSFLIYFSLKIYKKATFYSHNIIEKKKVKKLLETNGSKKLTSAQIKQVKEFYKRYGISNVNTLSHQYYYNRTGLFSEKYLPENIYYTRIEPALNRAIYFPALTDKNLLPMLFPMIKQPTTIVRNINGFFYSKEPELLSSEKVIELCIEAGRMIIKPSLQSGGGKNVLLFECFDGKTTSENVGLMELFDSYKKDFIVQEVISQHPRMAVLNATSLNTFRVMSYLDQDGVEVLSTILRFGRKGSFTDNASAGGITAGIHANGQLKDVGFDKRGNSFTHNDDGMLLRDIKLPFYDLVLDLVKKLHLSVPFFQLVSWDIGIDDSAQPILIELNVVGQGISHHELHNGATLTKLLHVLKN